MPEPTVTPTQYHHFIPTPTPFVSVLATPQYGTASVAVQQTESVSALWLTLAIVLNIGVFVIIGIIGRKRSRKE